MIEMALVLPLLLGLLIAIFEFGILYNNHITLTDATRAGARKAAVARFAGDGGASAVAAVRSAASNLDQSKLGVTVTANWSVPGSDVTVTASYDYSLTVLGMNVASGTLRSTTKERLE